MLTWLDSNSVKVYLASLAFFVFAFGDFFFAHRLSVDTDLGLLYGGATLVTGTVVANVAHTVGATMGK